MPLDVSKILDALNNDDFSKFSQEFWDLKQQQVSSAGNADEFHDSIESMLAYETDNLALLRFTKYMANLTRDTSSLRSQLGLLQYWDLTARLVVARDIDDAYRVLERAGLSEQRHGNIHLINELSKAVGEALNAVTGDYDTSFARAIRELASESPKVAADFILKNLDRNPAMQANEKVHLLQYIIRNIPLNPQIDPNFEKKCYSLLESRGVREFFDKEDMAEFKAAFIKEARENGYDQLAFAIEDPNYSFPVAKGKRSIEESPFDTSEDIEWEGDIPSKTEKKSRKAGADDDYFREQSDTPALGPDNSRPTSTSPISVTDSPIRPSEGAVESDEEDTSSPVDEDIPPPSPKR